MNIGRIIIWSPVFAIILGACIGISGMPLIAGYLIAYGYIGAISLCIINILVELSKIVDSQQ